MEITQKEHARDIAESTKHSSIQKKLSFETFMRRAIEARLSFVEVVPTVAATFTDKPGLGDDGMSKTSAPLCRARESFAPEC